MIAMTTTQLPGEKLGCKRDKNPIPYFPIGWKPMHTVNQGATVNWIQSHRYCYRDKGL